MSLTPCKFTIVSSGKVLSYDEARQYLIDNPEVWMEGRKEGVTKPTPETKLSSAFEKWKAAQNKQGISFDPKSQAKSDIEFLKAIAEYIKDKVAQGAYAFKDFVLDLKEQGIDGVDDYKDSWREFFDATIPPPSKPKEQEAGEGQPRGEKKVLGRIYRATQRDEVKAAIEEIGLDREVRSQEAALKKAADFVEEVGVDAALEAVRTDQFDPMVQSAIYGAIIGAYEAQIKDAPDVNAFRELLDKQTAVEFEFGQKSEGAGAFIGILPKIYEKSEIPYDYTAQARKFKKEFGEAASEEVLAKFKEAEAKYKEAQERIWQLEREREEALAKEGLSNIAEDIERKKRKAGGKKFGATNKFVKREQFEKDFAALKKMFSGKSGQLFSVGLPPELVRVAAFYIEGGARGFAQFSKKIVADFGDAVKPYLKDAYDAGIEEFKKAGGKIAEAVEIVGDDIRIPHALMRYYVEEGMTDVDQIAGEIKKDLEEEYPDLTIRQIRDAITRYGKKVNPTVDEIRGEINKLKAVGKMMSRLEDLKRGIKAEKNPQKKTEISEKARSLKKQIDAILKGAPKTKEEVRLAGLQKTLDKLLSGEYENGRDVVDDTPRIKALKEEIARTKQLLGLIPAKRSPEEIREAAAIKLAESQLEAIAKQIQDKELQKKKTGSTPILSEQLDELREKIAAKKQELEEMRKAAGIPELEKAAAYKKRTQEQIAELERRIREKDFSKKTRTVNVIYDEKGLELYGEKERAKEAFDVEFEREMLKRRTNSQKAIDLFWDIWGLPKSLKSTFDMSAPFRQGIIDVLTNNPVKTARTFKFMFQSTFDSLSKLKNAEEFYKKWITEVKASKDWPLMKASGLFLAMENAKLTAREEAFTTSLLKEMPLIEKPFKVGGKTILPGLRIASKSELAYNSFLNHLRVTQFREGVQALQDGGYSFDADPEQYKALATFIGVTTGRANLGSLESAAEILNRGLFSPRFMASRFQFLNPVYYAKMPPAARRIALMKAGKFVGVATTLLAMAALYYNNDDDDETSVEVNPLGDDFGKLKIGKTKIDFLGGVMGYVKFLAQTATLHKKDKKTGEIVKLGSTYGSANWIQSIASFFAGKAAPTMGTIIQFGLSQENEEGKLITPYGDEFSARKVFTDLTVPLYISDYKKIVEEHGGLTSAALIGSSFFGVGVNIPNEREKTPIQKARALLKPEEESRKRANEVIDAAIQTGDVKTFVDAVETLKGTYETGFEKRKVLKEVAKKALSEGTLTEKIGLEQSYLDEFFTIYKTGQMRAAQSEYSKKQLDRIRQLYNNRELTESIMQTYKAEYQQALKAMEFLKSTGLYDKEDVERMRPRWMRTYERKMLSEKRDVIIPKPAEVGAFKNWINRILK
jgi:hypothetical protein